MEKKLFNLSGATVSTDDETKTFSGYGAVFDNLDSHGDVIAKGAFAKTIASGAQPLMFLNHDPFSLPIGKWTDLSEDDYGLKVSGQFLDTQAGRDTYTAAKAGAISGLSIGFRPTESVKGKASGQPARTLKSVDLLEISVVTFPSNSRARIGDIKSLSADEDYERELVRLGMEMDEAKSFVASIKDSVETKYHDAAMEDAARNLLSKLQGVK